MHASILDWVNSGAPLLREQGPEPSPHLVSYACVVDGDHILLVDHLKAQLWLPTGGHVEAGEHPAETARREVCEELGQPFDLLTERALLATRVATQGNGPVHEDVTLWYAFRGDRHASLNWDRGEFAGLNWFSVDALPEARDPNLQRFLRQLMRWQQG